MQSHSSAYAPARAPETDFPPPTAAEHRGLATARLLWEERRFLFRISAAGLVLSVIIALLLPQTYMSVVRLMPPDQQSASMASLAAVASKAGNLGFLGSEMLGMKGSGALFTGVLRSRTVQDRVIDRFGLMKVYGVRSHEAARQVLSERSDVSEDRRTGILSITVYDRSPERSAQIAQGHVAELNRVVVELTTSAAHRERVFLEERLKEVKQDLDKAAADLGEFSSKNSTIDIKEQGRAMLEATATLQGSLIAAEAELRGLEQIYTANNVRVRAVQARISELRTQLQKLGGQPGKTEAAASDPLSVPSIRQLPLLGARYADFYRRTKMQETIFETLSAQYEIAKVEEAKEIPSVRVLDPANVPEKRSSPNRRLVVTICTFLSFAFGILYVLVGGYWEETDPADPRKTLIIEIGRSVEQSRLYRRVHTLSRPFAAAARALNARFVRRPKS